MEERLKAKVSFVLKQCDDMKSYLNQVMMELPNIPQNTVGKFVGAINHLSFCESEIQSIINDHKNNII